MDLVAMTAPDIHCAKFLPLSLTYLAYSHFWAQALLSGEFELIYILVFDLVTLTFVHIENWYIYWTHTSPYATFSQYTVSQKKMWCQTFCDNFINC